VSLRMTTVDCKGMEVQVGSAIRVLEIDATFLNSLQDEERQRVSSMIGEIFEVEEISQGGYATVSKEWDLGDGHVESHSISLAPKEMKLVT